MRKHSFRKIGAGVAVAGAGTLAAYVWAIRPWHLRWGATDDELRKPLPGDELAPDAKLKATHAITINAPAADVWPWLVQMGQNVLNFLLWRLVFEPAHFIMERKMLLGIKARSEKFARERSQEKMRAIPNHSGW